MTLPVSASASPDDWRAATEGAVATGATGLGVLTFAGADAAAFLHGQLSNDVNGLAPGQGRRATYNSPKGRMLATLFVWRAPGAAADRYAALVAEDIAEPVRRRLAMFVLRSKVAVADASPSTARFGVAGPRAAAAVAALGAVPGRGEAVAVDGGTCVHLPDGRFVVVAETAAAPALRDALLRGARPVGGEVWTWLAIRAGVPTVTAATQDQFVPQTANQDALGALDFRKGCYPGQEIVARSQYLGRLKERLFVLATAGDAPAPGTRLYAAAFGDQACGTVVNSAPRPEGGALFLAVLQAAAAEGPIAVGAQDGAPASVEPLPYPLPEPTEPRGRVKL